MKKCLHVNSYFLTNNIHYNLYKSLLKRKPDTYLIPVYKFFRSKHIAGVDIDYVFSSLDKKLFFTKVPKVLFLFFRKQYSGFDYIHSHTLISDGIPGYIISLLTRKPLQTSVRSTDISLFIDGSFIFRALAKLIIKKSETVFFISPSLQKKFVARYPNLDTSKYCLLPNGLDDFWMENRPKEAKQWAGGKKVKLLFVGEIMPRKNLKILIDFLKSYSDYQYELHIVGKNTDNFDFNTISSSISNGNLLYYHGPIYNKKELLNIYRSCDIFVLLSLSETFGVVYIESLSQGLPIIYTEGQGVDGFFEEGEVGYSNNPADLEQLHSNVLKVLADYERISASAIAASASFDWDIIVSKYINRVSIDLTKE